jgi:hypothetical protein
VLQAQTIGQMFQRVAPVQKVRWRTDFHLRYGSLPRSLHAGRRCLFMRVVGTPLAEKGLGQGGAFALV